MLRLNERQGSRVEVELRTGRMLVEGRVPFCEALAMKAFMIAWSSGWAQG